MAAGYRAIAVAAAAAAATGIAVAGTVAADTAAADTAVAGSAAEVGSIAAEPEAAGKFGEGNNPVGQRRY